MAERPILFNGEMVRAILDGRKTQTRRPIMFKPKRIVQPDSVSLDETSGRWVVTSGPNIDELKCPYGVPGDRLVVRERMRVCGKMSANIHRDYPSKQARALRQIKVRYEADQTESAWIDYPERLKAEPVVGKCLAYGGFREAWRIRLELTEVRVERLQSIITEDIIAEGLESYLREYDAEVELRQKWQQLWNSINAPRGFGWDTNPWVWALSFKAVTP